MIWCLSQHVRVPTSHVDAEVTPALAAVRAVWTLELRILATLPLPVLVEAIYVAVGLATLAKVLTAFLLALNGPRGNDPRAT